MQARLGLTIALIALAALAFACKVPGGTVAHINGVILFGQLNWAITLILALASWRMKPRIEPALAFLTIVSVFHPVWWLSPWSGDCGTTMEMLALLLTVASMGVNGWALVLRNRRRTSNVPYPS